MVDKEYFLKERYLLLKDKEDLEKSSQYLYYVFNGATSFNSLYGTHMYIKGIFKIIDDRIKEIDQILNI